MNGTQINLITRLLSLKNLVIYGFLLLLVVPLNGQNKVFQKSGNRCKYLPKLDEFRTWKADLKTKVKSEKITATGLSVMDGKLFMIDKNIKVPDIYSFDLDQADWVLSSDSTLYHGLKGIYQDKFLPWGMDGMELVGDTLFAIGLSEFPFSAIDLTDQEIVFAPAFELPNYKGSEGASGIAYHYPLVYLAYHSLDYDRAVNQTQRLFAVDCRTGEIVFEVPLFPSEHKKDFVHALSYFGEELWHLRERNLTRMDASTGAVLETYQIPEIGRPSSICFYKNALWISTYSGGLHELPLDCVE